MIFNKLNKICFLASSLSLATMSTYLRAEEGTTDPVEHVANQKIAASQALEEVSLEIEQAQKERDRYSIDSNRFVLEIHDLDLRITRLKSQEAKINANLRDIKEVETLLARVDPVGFKQTLTAIEAQESKLRERANALAPQRAQAEAAKAAIEAPIALIQADTVYTSKLQSDLNNGINQEMREDLQMITLSILRDLEISAGPIGNRRLISSRENAGDWKANLSEKDQLILNALALRIANKPSVITPVLRGLDPQYAVDANDPRRSPTYRRDRLGERMLSDIESEKILGELAFIFSEENLFVERSRVNFVTAQGWEHQAERVFAYGKEAATLYQKISANADAAKEAIAVNEESKFMLDIELTVASRNHAQLASRYEGLSGAAEQSARISGEHFRGNQSLADVVGESASKAESSILENNWTQAIKDLRATLNLEQIARSRHAQNSAHLRVSDSISE